MWSTVRPVLINIYKLWFFIYKSIFLVGRRIETNFVLPGAHIGRGVIIKSGVRIYRGVTIGDHTFINTDTRIDPLTSHIGKYCSISHNVKIGLGAHPINFFSTSPAFYSRVRGFVDHDYFDEASHRGKTYIGNDVFIAANAVVLAGVSVGDGAVISAGAVVTRDVPPYAIVGGVPARILRYRFDEVTIQKLIESAWWDRDPKFVAKLAYLGFDIDKFLESLRSDGKF